MNILIYKTIFSEKKNNVKQLRRTKFYNRLLTVYNCLSKNLIIFLGLERCKFYLTFSESFNCTIWIKITTNIKVWKKRKAFYSRVKLLYKPFICNSKTPTPYRPFKSLNIFRQLLNIQSFMQKLPTDSINTRPWLPSQLLLNSISTWRTNKEHIL